MVVDAKINPTTLKKSGEVHCITQLMGATQADYDKVLEITKPIA